MSKIVIFLLFSNACRSDSKSPTSPITVAGAVTYLATASICMRIRRLVLLKSFLFLHRIFPVRKSIFVKAGSALEEVGIPLEVLSSKYGSKQSKQHLFSRHNVTT